MLLETSEKNPNSKARLPLMGSPRISGGQGSEGSYLTEGMGGLEQHSHRKLGVL